VISELIRILRDSMDVINDEDTLLEMLTFVRNEKLRAEAEDGAHDDCVMALAIAFYIRPQQTAQVKQANPTVKRWTRSQWEDYNRASAAEKEMLRRRWGDPGER
jgi:phage terminase large subunit